MYFDFISVKINEGTSEISQSSKFEKNISRKGHYETATITTTIFQHTTITRTPTITYCFIIAPTEIKLAKIQITPSILPTPIIAAIPQPTKTYLTHSEIKQISQVNKVQPIIICDIEH